MASLKGSDKTSSSNQNTDSDISSDETNTRVVVPPDIDEEAIALKEILEEGTNLSATDRLGNTVVHRALSKSLYQLVHHRVQYLPDCNACNKNGTTFLHIIAESKQDKLAKKFIKYGANVNCIDRMGRTPLMMACKRGRYSMALLLLKAESDLQAKDCYGWTAKDYSCLMGYIQIQNLLEQCEKNGLEAIIDLEECSSEEEETDDRTDRNVRRESEVIIPIKVEKRDRSSIDMDETEAKVTLDDDALHDAKGKLRPFPQVVAALKSSASQLEQFQAWVKQQQEITEIKERQCQELKVQIKRLLKEKTSMINRRENLENEINTLIETLLKTASKREAEALNNLLRVLKCGLFVLQNKYDLALQERDELKTLLQKDDKIHGDKKTELEAKADELSKITESLSEKLISMQDRLEIIIEDLINKEKYAKELLEHLKILLRGTYKLLEEKRIQVSNMLEELANQQKYIDDAKENYNTIKAEKLMLGKNIDELLLKIGIVKRHVVKLLRDIEKCNLMKNLIDAGVMDTGIKCSKAVELDSEDRMYDPTGVMSVRATSPTVCNTKVDAMRYAWRDNLSKDLFISSEKSYKDKSIKSSHHSEEKVSVPDKIPTEEVVYLNLEEKLAGIFSKYKEFKQESDVDAEESYED